MASNGSHEKEPRHRIHPLPPALSLLPPANGVTVGEAAKAKSCSQRPLKRSGRPPQGGKQRRYLSEFDVQLRAARDVPSLLHAAQQQAGALSWQQAVSLLTRLAELQAAGRGAGARNCDSLPETVSNSDGVAEAAQLQTAEAAAAAAVVSLAVKRLAAPPPPPGGVPPSQITHLAGVAQRLRLADGGLLPCLERWSNSCASRLNGEQWGILASAFISLRHRPGEEWRSALVAGAGRTARQLEAPALAALLRAVAILRPSPVPQSAG